MPRNLTIATIEELCLSSGNVCAFPDCNLPMYDFKQHIKIGEKAHIEAVEKRGPRYNENQTVKERNSIGNLMLMCPNHHTLIDRDSKTYSVQVLKEMKRRHEETQHDRIKRKDITSMAKAFLSEIQSIRDINGVTIFNQISTYGLKILPRNYFEEHKSITTDFESWKKGFSFNLESIKAEKEFRRNAVLSEIKRILDAKRRVLLLGEMGMSKTTILMEILCDYFDKDYEILYNWGNIQIKNEEDLIGFVEDLLNRDKKILVALDNIHDKKLLPIFYIIERLETHVKTKNLIFLLTARIPEYNLIVKERLFEVQEQIHRNSIQKFRDDNTFHYRIPYFSDREVQEFIKKYKVEFVENDEKCLSILAKKTLEYSGGNPIMVRYYVLEQGLRKSAEDRYLHYLIDPVNMKPDAMKIQTILACSLLEFGGVQVNDELLERMKLIKHARDLRESLLSRHEDGIWKTLHLRWDMELIAFLFAIKEENLVEERINYLRDAIRSIFSIEDEKMASSVIASLYNIPTINARGISRIPIEIIERAVQNQVPSFLSNHTKSRMFSLDIATAYSELGKYEVALDWCNKSLELDQSFIGSWHNKGVTLSRIGNYQEAIDCFNMALKLDPFNADTLHNKGITLRKLGDNKGAMESFNLALKLKPTSAELLMDMSGMYLQERKPFKALEFCLKALKIDTRNPQIWNNMGLTCAALLMSYTALKCFKASIELDEAYSNAWYNMASTLDDIGMYVEAIECYENAIKNDPNNADAWNNKGTVLHKLGRINEAIECLDKAIEKDPYKSNSYDNKRKALLDK